MVIKKSKIHGRGVFAKKNLAKNEIVLMWKPKILSKTEIENLSDNKKHYLYFHKKTSKYFLMQSPEKYVNHSCSPNTKVKNLCDVAIKNIKKGEEITSDYNKNSAIEFKCKCGEINCRSNIE